MDEQKEEVPAGIPEGYVEVAPGRFMKDGRFVRDPRKPAKEASEAKPEKKRGRPPGSKTKARAASATGTADEAGPKKVNGAHGAAPSVNPASLAMQIEGAHRMLALMTGITELQLQPKEAEMLAGSMVNVQREFGVAVSGKVTALLGLLGSVAIIYGPRVYVINQKIEQQKRAQPQHGTAPRATATSQVEPEVYAAQAATDVVSH